MKTQAFTRRALIALVSTFLVCIGSAQAAFKDITASNGDASCPVCTNCMYTPGSCYVDVAASVNPFVKAAFYGTWSKAALTGTMTTPATLFVDTDKP